MEVSGNCVQSAKGVCTKDIWEHRKVFCIKQNSGFFLCDMRYGNAGFAIKNRYFGCMEQ